MKARMKALAFPLALLLLAACNRGQQNESAAVQQGVERSVADVRAAKSAAATPAEPSLSAGALANAARTRADALHDKAQAKAAKGREEDEDAGEG